MEQPQQLNTPDWYERIAMDSALLLVREVLPGLKSLSIHNLADAAEDLGASVDFEEIRLYDMGDDGENFDDTLGRLSAFEGRLVITTHYTDRNGGSPFLVQGHRLREFVCQHGSLYRDVFFNVDAVIVAIDQGRLYLIHHNGVGAHVQLPKRDTGEAELLGDDWAMSGLIDIDEVV